jgi:hypothetical protein
MNYYVARNGQQYGPYSDEVVRRYLAEGSLQFSDSARTETGQQWVTLGQLFPPAAVAAPSAPAAVAAFAPAYPASPTTPQQYAEQAQATMQVMPPSLHWAVVLVLNMFTSGVFGIVWMFVQSSFVRRIHAASKATTYYIWSLVCLLVSCFVVGVGTAIAQDNAQTGGLVILLALAGMIAGCVLLLIGVFDVKRSLETYYNSMEPIGLKLNGVMTFFFNVIYSQYHLGRIADWKRTGVLWS